MMEKPRYRTISVISFVVILLGATAFSCCLAAEFKKSKAKDMKLDGSLCHLPRSPAFGLGIAALLCLCIAQIVGTTMAATRLYSREKRPNKTQFLPIALLILSWISFGLATILLCAGSSMNNTQVYGRGWMNRECYFVKDGVYTGSAVLTAATIMFIIGFTFTTKYQN